MYLRLAKMRSNSLPFRSPHRCHALSIISPGWVWMSLLHSPGRMADQLGVLCALENQPLVVSGLESCRGFLKGLHLGPPCGCRTHRYQPASDRELRQLGPRAWEPLSIEGVRW